MVDNFTRVYSSVAGASPAHPLTNVGGMMKEHKLEYIEKWTIQDWGRPILLCVFILPIGLAALSRRYGKLRVWH